MIMRNMSISADVGSLGEKMSAGFECRLATKRSDDLKVKSARQRVVQATRIRTFSPQYPPASVGGC